MKVGSFEMRVVCNLRVFWVETYFIKSTELKWRKLVRSFD